MSALAEALAGPVEGRLDRAAAVIRAMAPHYTGVYLYRLEGDELVLRGLAGRPSPHERIPVGTGICGTAVARNEDIVVPDVALDDRYLACSPQTRSEAVVLVRHRGEVVGQIDIDSDVFDPFDQGDLTLLQALADELGPAMV